MNQASQNRIVALAPPVRSLALALASRMADLGSEIEIVQGGRTWEEQDALYAQGRFTLEVVNQKRQHLGMMILTIAENSRTVTQAQGGYSWHNFFMAFDAAPFDVLGRPDWDVTHPAWKEMLDIGRELGFDLGADWHMKDNPHFELTGRFPTTPTDEVRTIYSAGGLAAVWRAAYGEDRA